MTLGRAARGPVSVYHPAHAHTLCPGCLLLSRPDVPRPRRSQRARPRSPPRPPRILTSRHRRRTRCGSTAATSNTRATAGTLPIRGQDGKVAARMFFVAYTKDGEDAKTRPVSFLYNGGPGAATVWLHMGSFAPRRVQMADEGFQPAPPYKLVDNENSLLDVTDLVFVDAIRHRLQPRGGRRQRRAVPRRSAATSAPSAISSTTYLRRTAAGRRRSSSSARATARSGRRASRRSCRRATASS